MTIPSPSPQRGTRRISDQGIVRSVNLQMDSERRRTVGGDVATPAKFTPSMKCTPSKNRSVNLGSSAASAYYFSDLPKTPQSTAKKQQYTSSAGVAPSPGSQYNPDETVNLADTSLLSLGTSSSEGSDLLNKSILSDTTELTASNFVLQATSRQRLMGIPRFKSVARNDTAEKEMLLNDENLITFSPAKSVVGGDARAREPFQPLHNTFSREGDIANSPGSFGVPRMANDNAVAERTSQPSASPSMWANLSTSPSSIRKLTESLRKAKHHNDKGKETRRSGSGLRRFSSVGRSITHDQSPMVEARVAVDVTETSLGDLFDGLLHNAQGTEVSSSQLEAKNGYVASPSPTMESSTPLFRLPGTPNSNDKFVPLPKEFAGHFPNSAIFEMVQDTLDGESTSESAVLPIKDPFSSPISNIADDESHSRLTPDSHRTIAATSLSPSPRRVANPESLDSPARNTRSASKARQSPLTTSKSPDTSMKLGLHESTDASSNISESKRTRESHEGDVSVVVIDSRNNDVRLDLSPSSPRRFMNLESIGSPARHTRSSSKMERSPSKSIRSSETSVKLDFKEGLAIFDDGSNGIRKRENSEEKSPYATFVSQTAGLRVSDISLRRPWQTRSQSKRRNSTASHLSLASHNADDTMSLATANTADLNVLLGNDREMRSHKTPSPLVQGLIPKSILNSSKKRKSLKGDIMGSHHNKKTVAFGSPEAAEYHIGSPSVSLTPMPKGAAKAMFMIPSAQSSSSSSSKSSEKISPTSSQGSARHTFDATVEIEADISVLLQNMTQVNQSIDSAFSTDESPEKQSVELSSTDFLAIVAKETPDIPRTSSALVANSPTASSPALSNASSVSELQNDDTTMELETDIHRLLANTLDQATTTSMLSFGEESNSRTSHESSPANSVDMADAESAISFTSRASQHDFEETLHSSAQKLNFDSNFSQDLSEGDTVHSPKHPGTEVDDGTMEERQVNEVSNTVELEADVDTEELSPYHGFTKYSESPDSQVDDVKIGDPAVAEEDNTVELEADLSTLLATAGVESTTTNREIPVPVSLSDRFPKMTSKLAPPTNRMSFGERMQPLRKTDVDSLGTIHTRDSDTDLHEEGEDMAIADASEDELSWNDTECDGIHRLEDSPSKDEIIEGNANHSQTPSEIRRSSRHRFSLTPNSQLSISIDGGMSVAPSPLSEYSPYMECHSSNDDVAPSGHCYEDGAEIIELTSADITDAAGLSLDFDKGQYENDADTVLAALKASSKLRNPFIAEALEGFVLAVCGEVEAKAEASEDSNLCFNAIVDNRPETIMHLQKALRSQGGRVASDQLKNLADVAKRFVEFEWISWETQVADSLNKTIESINSEFEEDDERLERSVTLAIDTHEALSLLEGRAASKARRRSMTRRQNASSELRDEIQEINRRILVSERDLGEVRVQEEAAFILNRAIRTNFSTNEKLDDSRVSAESSQSKFMSINGLHSWTPVAVTDSKVVVVFIGASPKTCVHVSFDMSKSGRIDCEAKVDASYFRQRRGKVLRITPMTNHFLDANVSFMVDNINKSIIESPSDIGTALQRLEFLLGRLEMSTHEISVIHKRYNIKLQADPEGERTDFVLSTDFASRGETGQLRATFELSSAYPFAPLNISLDDREVNMNVDALKRQLIKGAKPGFGYLTRTFDTISAYIRQESR